MKRKKSGLGGCPVERIKGEREVELGIQIVSLFTCFGEIWPLKCPGVVIAVHIEFRTILFW